MQRHKQFQSAVGIRALKDSSNKVTVFLGFSPFSTIFAGYFENMPPPQYEMTSLTRMCWRINIDFFRQKLARCPPLSSLSFLTLISYSQEKLDPNPYTQIYWRIMFFSKGGGGVKTEMTVLSLLQLLSTYNYSKLVRKKKWPHLKICLLPSFLFISTKLGTKHSLL